MIPKALRPVFEPIRPQYLRLRGRTPKGEERAVEFYRRYIRKDDVVIEVGANVGGATLLLSDLASYVYALEPVPSTFRYLRAFTAKKKNVKIYNLGASHERAKIRMHIAKNPEVNSRFRIKNQRYERTVPATLVRLDSIHYAPKPTCIVMDCEGSEVDALKGASGLFDSESIRCILVETHLFSDGSSTLENVIALVRGHKLEFEIEEDSNRMLWVLAHIKEDNEVAKRPSSADPALSDIRLETKGSM